MSDHPEEFVGAHGLVMPFVVCKDRGGPYEADAFCAGWEAGAIDFGLRMLSSLGGSLERWVPSPLVPQLELLAMRHGFAMTAEPWEAHPDEWTRVKFEPSSATDPPAGVL